MNMEVKVETKKPWNRVVYYVPMYRRNIFCRWRDICTKCTSYGQALDIAIEFMHESNKP